jgi:phage terminase Nu1 subunit (DNA packaging protein)
MTQHQPPTIENAVAAELLGVKIRQVHHLVTNGQLIRPTPGCVTVASAADYIAKRQAIAANAAAGSELEAERVLLVRAQRRLVDQRRRRAAGQLIEAQLAHDFAANLVITTRNAFMNCGSVLAPLAARANGPHAIRKLIDDELRGICEQLAAQAEAGPADNPEADEDEAGDDLDTDHDHD